MYVPQNKPFIFSKKTIKSTVVAFTVSRYVECRERRRACTKN